MLLTWQRAEEIPHFSIVSGDTYQRSGRKGTEKVRWYIHDVYSLSNNAVDELILFNFFFIELVGRCQKKV